MPKKVTRSSSRKKQKTTDSVGRSSGNTSTTQTSTTSHLSQKRTSSLIPWFLVLVVLLLGAWFWYAFLGGRDLMRMYFPATQNQILTGRFRGDVPAADSPGRTITLETKVDGTAAFLQDYHNDQPVIVETGSWEPGDQGTLVVRLDKRNGEPLTTTVPMVFVFHPQGADSLELVKFDPRDWGVNGLQLQRLDPLLGSTWVWRDTVLSTGQRTETDEKQSFSVTFAEDGTLSVTTDCNNGGGSYQLVGLDGLTFGALFSTRMFCADSQETEFFRQLEQVNRSLLENNTLQFTLQNDSGTMIFEGR